jgi:hypothetical protein
MNVNVWIYTIFIGRINTYEHYLPLRCKKTTTYGSVYEK